MANHVIKVEKVSKNFRLPHEKTTTLKGAFLNVFKKRSIHPNTEIQHALHDVSFQVEEGDFFGIVGRNGSGKSTLLKMLAGIYQPTKGNIQVKGKLVPFIELGVGFNPELTGRENVYLNGALLGFSKEEIDGLYDDIVAFAELERFMDQKLKNYSSGMQVRLAFSMAVRANADILLIDEVLAVGDADFQRKCFSYFKQLKKNKTTVVFVSHDMGAIREFCNKAVLIDENQLKMIGKPSDIAREYSMLFDGAQPEEQQQEEKTTRWGNGRARLDKVRIAKDGDKIQITARVTANDIVDSLMYGMHVFGEDGVEITAMNNRMLRIPDITNLTKDAKISLSWSVLNIFNDGKYSVSLTLADSDGTILDWLNDAGAFSVRRPERSTTAVLPPVKVEYKVI